MPPPANPGSPSDATHAANKTLALILLGVIVTFLGGAFAVALLVLYGPF